MLPQCERVVALHFCGSVPNKEGSIRHVPELIVHLLPKTRAKHRSVGVLWVIPQTSQPNISSVQDRFQLNKKKMKIFVCVVCYLDISPQYHSASCSEPPPSLPPLLLTPATPEDSCWGFTGFGGRAGREWERTVLLITFVYFLFAFIFPMILQTDRRCDLLLQKQSPQQSEGTCSLTNSLPTNTHTCTQTQL